MNSKCGFVVLLVLFGLVLGCSEPKTPARLTGKVTYKSDLVKGGTITLYGKEDSSYSIIINSDGTFDKADLPSGDLDVTIETESVKTNPKGEYGGGKAPKDKGMSSTPASMGGAPKGEYVKIPEKYAKRETSGLKVTLGKGQNNKDFPLTD